MPKIDDLLKSGTPFGVAIGLGAAVLAAAIVPALPALARAGRPAARAAIKSGLVLIEKGREVMAEATEDFEDLLAEVRAELQQENTFNRANMDNGDAIVKAEKEQA